MFLLIIISVFLVWGSLFEIWGLRLKDRRSLTIGITLIIFTFSFLRWERGADWLSYYNTFEATQNWDFTDYYGGNFEFGYWLLNVFVKSIFDNYTVLLFVYASILFYFRTKGILQFTKYPVTALLITWGMGFAGMYFVRSGIAVAILFYAIKYIQQRRFIVFLLFLILGAAFHRSVLLFILAYFIYPLKIRPSMMILMIFGSIVFGFLVSKIVLSFLGSVVGGMIEYKLNAYLGEEQGATYGLKVSYFTILMNGIIKRVSLVLVGIFLLKKMNVIDVNFRGYVNLLWFGTLIYFSTVMLSLSLPRLAYPFDEVQLVILPSIFYVAKDKVNRTLLWGILVLFLTYRFCNNLLGTYFDLYLPYKSIFNMDLPVHVY